MNKWVSGSFYNQLDSQKKKAQTKKNKNKNYSFSFSTELFSACYELWPLKIKKKKKKYNDNSNETLKLDPLFFLVTFYLPT